MHPRGLLGSLPLGRRGFLGLSAGFAAWAGLGREGRCAEAAQTDPRLVVLVLHGGLDGLALAAPIQDPAFAELRGDLGFADGLPLVDGFVLNPLMRQLHGLFLAGDALIAHAVASPYRDRSHFDAIDVLEGGCPVPRAARSGWLHRALAVLPRPMPAALPHGLTAAVPIGVVLDDRVPPLLKGDAVPVANWTAGRIPAASEAMQEQVLTLYDSTDPALATALRAGQRLERLADGLSRAAEGVSPAVADALAAASLLAQPAGPRVAVLGSGGWDTHRDEVPALNRRLIELDAIIDALRRGLGQTWGRTVLIVVTEFGRAVRINGSQGSDHGTATVALLAGGAVAGGRVLADWPGLGEGDLLDGRDLRPTLDLRALFKGVLRDHLGVSPERLDGPIFPASERVRPLDGLLRAV